MIENTWVKELEEFENTIVRGLYDLDFDSAVQSVDIWLALLVNNKDKDYRGWYARLVSLRQRAQDLKLTLQERMDQIHSCVKSCTQRQGGCWPDNCDNGPCCDSEPQTCNGGLDATGGCPGGWEGGGCRGWTGCCGDWVDCGRLCNAETCQPTAQCDTPLGGRRWCCEVTNLEPYKSPGGDCEDNSGNIIDNIIKVYSNQDGKRYDAIRILDAFISDTEKLNEIIFRLDREMQEIKEESYDKMHEAFYIWQDRVVGGTPQGQLVGHIAYVKIEGVDPKAGFRVPYPNPSPDLILQPPPAPPIPMVCMDLIMPNPPEFTLTVARFDEDTAKMGPISRFRRFKFSRGQISADDEGFIRSEAERFRALIDANQYAEVSDKNRCIRILKDYGIVTKVRVHYGPGVTPKPGDSVTAAQKNQDIYIMGTSSDL